MSVQQFRKRPVVIEAIRYIPGKTCQDVAAFTGVSHSEDDCFDDAEWVIETLEGTMFARPGDWIIRGVQGEFYPCKPDIFDATYEAEARAVRAEAALKDIPPAGQLKLWLKADLVALLDELRLPSVSEQRETG